MILGFTTKEIISPIKSIISFLWGFRQNFLLKKSDKQKIKFETYTKISEKINLFHKNVDSLYYFYRNNTMKEIKIFKLGIEELKVQNKVLELKLVNIKNQFKNDEEIKFKFSNLKKIEQELYELELEFEKVKADIEVKNSNLSDDKNRIKLDEICNRITSIKKMLAKEQEQISVVNDDVDKSVEQRLAHKDVEDNIIVSERKIYDFTNDVDQFILGFYEISDLQIIASTQIRNQLDICRAKAELFSIYISK